jgi:hypothetical protein
MVAFLFLRITLYWPLVEAEKTKIIVSDPNSRKLDSGFRRSFQPREDSIWVK